MSNFYLAIKNINQKGLLDSKHGYCSAADINGQSKAKNLSPELHWGLVPEGTKSFAITCIDVDVPTDFSHANKKGVEIPAEMPRQDYIHWLCADLKADLTYLPQGFMNLEKMMDGYKATPGVNNLSDGGQIHLGYYGPCPPVNDLRLHRYVFTLYALRCEKLILPENYKYHDLLKAMKNYIIDTASAVAIYTRNPKMEVI